MRICPNPECPYRRKHQRAAEYTAAADRCSDCGGALADGAEATAAASAAPAETPRPSDFSSRVLVTAAVIVGGLVAAFIPLPLSAPDGWLFGLGRRVPRLFDISAEPYFQALILVELVVAVVPSWNRLRFSGPAGRRRLDRVALAIGLLFVVVQGFQYSALLERAGLAGASAAADSAVPGWVFGTAMAIASLVYPVGAWLCSRRGLGAGWATIALVIYAPRMLEPLRSLAARVDEGVVAPAVLTILIALLAALGAGAIWVSRQMHGALRLPLAGLLPVVGAGWILELVLTTARLFTGGDAARNWLYAEPLRWHLVFGILALNLVIIFSLLLHRPARVAAAAVAYGAPADPGLRRVKVLDQTRQVFPIAIGISAAFALAPWLSTLALQTVWSVRIPSQPAESAIIVAVIGADLWRELKARRERNWATAWTLSRAFEVAPALEALRAAGIPAEVRGDQCRTLWHFFGPELPIEVLVPEGQVEAARAALFPQGVPGEEPVAAQAA